jgi:hypothetical protein
LSISNCVTRPPGGVWAYVSLPTPYNVIMARFSLPSTQPFIVDLISKTSANILRFDIILLVEK